MRQRTGRQKFQNLRLMTFQDWIIPHYNNITSQNTVNTMKNHSMPVFSYTKMETGPPLSTINSQFAWAGHVLPDLVQEQSDRLLRRLERPRTAGARTTNLRNGQMKDNKLLRPSTAVSSLRQNENSNTVYHVGGRAVHKIETQTEMKSHEIEIKDQGSLESDRSSSPDFIANLYKEYEEKIAADHQNETQSFIEANSPTSPCGKLLRRPSVQFKLDKRYSGKKSNSDQSTQCNKIVSCIVKLPTEHSNSKCTKITIFNTEKLRSRSEPPQSETWLDLSEICQPSDDEAVKTCSEMEFRRSSLTTENCANLELLDLIERGDDAQNKVDMKNTKMKLTRPSSSKMSRKLRPKSKHKKHRLCAAEESTKEYKKEAAKKPETGCRQAKTKTDKLREEIETQMSKLDFDTSGLPKRKNVTETKSTVIASENLTPKIKAQSWSNYSGYSLNQRSIPLKKIPIQILSDPFTSNFKVYQNEKSVQNMQCN